MLQTDEVRFQWRVIIMIIARKRSNQKFKCINFNYSYFIDLGDCSSIFFLIGYRPLDCPPSCQTVGGEKTTARSDELYPRNAFWLELWRIDSGLLQLWARWIRTATEFLLVSSNVRLCYMICFFVICEALCNALLHKGPRFYLHPAENVQFLMTFQTNRDAVIAVIAVMFSPSADCLTFPLSFPLNKLWQTEKKTPRLRFAGKRGQKRRNGKTFARL